ncbi:MAG: DUF4197 domain-containing protein [Flavobacteriales bacterium]|jgi:hypothetical protein|nr:DUF4197 domain-containing protein [Flavobacteriales bacterium]
MKKIGLLFGICSIMLLPSCDVLNQVAEDVVNTGSGDGGGSSKPSLTNDEVIAGLKEALTIGIQKGADLASKVDGFNKNDIIRIPWPQEAIKVKEWANDKPMFKEEVDKIEVTFNRAAEEASKKAAPIFVDAIKGMSVTDGFEILNGPDDAATNYLKKTTTPALTSAFKPVVHDAIETVKLASLWDPVATGYNKVAKVTGKDQVNTDLDQYVTDKGISGLFYLVKQEEKKIRKDPVAQVTDLLKKVFGSLLD